MGPLRGCASCTQSCFPPLCCHCTKPVTCLVEQHTCIPFLPNPTLISEEIVWVWKDGKEQLPDQFTYCAGCTLLLFPAPLENIMVRRIISSYSVGSYLASGIVLLRLLQTNWVFYVTSISQGLLQEVQKDLVLLHLHSVYVCVHHHCDSPCALLFICQFFKCIVSWILLQNGTAKRR